MNKPIRDFFRNREVTLNGWWMLSVVSILPMIALVLVLTVFLGMQVDKIKQDYNIDADEEDVPFVIFDKTTLINSATKYDYMDMVDFARKSPDIFLNSTFQANQNNSLMKKYSFLVVTKGKKIVYSGDTLASEAVEERLISEYQTRSALDAKYYAAGGNKYLYKKISLSFSNGKKGSACIITNMNTSLPHITFITAVLISTLVIAAALIVGFVISYSYYNILIPIRTLQNEVSRIAAGDLDHQVKSHSYNEFNRLYNEIDMLRITLKENIEERNRTDAYNREVLGNISHDLKTPLTAIKGYAEGIIDGVANTPDKQERYIRTILTKSVDMQGILDELSFFTKIYKREQSFDYTTVRINHYFRECFSDYNLDMETRGINYRFTCDIGNDEMIDLDVDKIKRVIANIVGNSAKYIQHDHGKIDVVVRTDGELGVVVTVNDNGKGIEKEALPHIFERFYRTDSSRNSSTGGSGLGLTISKRIIEEHGGQIWAKSVIDRGTEIGFYLPRIRRTTSKK